MYSDSMFNLLKRIRDGSFLFLWKMLAFLFLPFFDFGAQIRCPQNWYTDLRSALNQPLIKMKWETIFISFKGHSNMKIQKNTELNLGTFLVNPLYYLCRKIKSLKEHWEEIQVFRIVWIVWLCGNIVKNI